MGQELVNVMDKGRYEKARRPEGTCMLPNSRNLTQWRTEWVGKGSNW